MRRPTIIKILSGLINLLTCSAAVIIVLIKHDFFGSSDIYPFLFWTIPLAIGLSVSGQTVLNLIRTKYFMLRVLFILIIAGIISFGWVYFVYLILGPWINAFSFPIFYLWIIGNAVQFFFLELLLPKPSVYPKISKLLLRLLIFPLVLVLTVIIIFLAAYLKDYLT